VAGRVLVVGAINTDLVIVAPRLPTPGETVIGGGLQTFGGGKGANAAVAASRAGADVLLIGAVGADSSGTDAIAALRGDGVDTSGVAVLDAEPTGAALIVVDPRGENQITIGPGANGAVSAAHVRASLAPALPTADVVLVSTEIPLAAVAAAIEASAAAGVTCILNPAPVIAGLPGLLSFRPMLTPNELELRALVSGLASASTPAGGDGVPAHLNALGERTRAPVIVTLGGEGCAVRLPGGELRRIPAHPVADVVDTTGAGDTFNGVFAARLAMGDTLSTALETAIVAASLSVTAIGARAGMPTAAAIDRAMHPMSS
jgi:ribokinase